MSNPIIMAIFGFYSLIAATGGQAPGVVTGVAFGMSLTLWLTERKWEEKENEG